ncbi:DUF6226 family protein [Herbiconiux moechotypicola]|uniref:Uncharacterized protein n=1 Tax=Herbiconiux moechotypicola TaxID=637393 RepID=A0ABP5QCA0_9MICO|nr:DUF6226 family protein [Herbiconiux moechotypicola]MCS5729684.1 DUF6226 family protein [Herbiconiux moechotypicola]
MSGYVRPAVEAVVFRDGDGRVIEYGSRWEGSPPEDTYSMSAHPERFAPLHTVADALIDYLRDICDVSVEEGDDVVADLIRPPSHDVVRAVRVRPRDPACASVTVVMTAYPGIYLHAGVLHDFHYPVCGCDACDSTWQHEADRLEEQVLAVVAGNYRETLERREGETWVGFAFTYPDGASSGGSREEGMSPESYAVADAALRAVTAEWAAWPRRQGR